MNIFTKIGNSIEKAKEKNESFKEKYWKLSPAERIDYDNKLKYIENERHKPFSLIIAYFNSFLFITVFLFIIMIANGNYELFLPIKHFATVFIKIFWFIIMLDLFSTLMDNPDKKIKELKRRFKLC